MKRAVQSFIAAAAVFIVIRGAHATTQTSTWIVLDAKLRSQTVQAMKAYLYFVEHDTGGVTLLEQHPHDKDIIVTALENTDDNTRQLILLQYDTLQFTGTDNIRTILGEDLYKFIAARTGYDYDVNGTTPEQRLCDEIWLPSERITLALDKQQFRLSPAFTFCDEIGNSAVNMPWWEYGMFRAGVENPYFKFYLQLPFAPGLNKIWFIQSRRMDGAFGADVQFNAENWSGEIAYATLAKPTSLYSAFIFPPLVNYVSFVGQVVYSIPEPVGNFGAVQLSFGAGVHVIKHDSITSAGDDTDTQYPSSTIITPIARFAFISTNGIVQCSAQYYNASIFFQATVHVIGPLWISGSGLMIKPIRIPQYYEQSSFLFITPMLRW